MRRAIPLASLALAAAVLSAPSATASGSERRAFEPPDEAPSIAAGIIVKTRADARAAALRGAVSDLVDGSVRTDAVLGDITAIRTEPMSLADAQALAAQVAQRPDVVWARADALMQADERPDAAPPVAVNDPLYGNLYNLWDNRDATNAEVAPKAPSAWPAGGYGVKAPALWAATRGAPSLVVAVLDTGVRPHPDLAPQLVAGYDLIADLATAHDGDGRDADASDPGDYVTSEYSCFDDEEPVNNESSWHGTHVSGTVAAAADNVLGVAGVAPNVKIQPVRVLGVCGGFTSDIATGIAWAAGVPVAGLPANPTPARVINLSLGGPGTCDPAYQEAIDAARAAGSVVVVSAGNDNADAATKSPASCNGVVVVGSSTEYGDRAIYSNVGSIVDVSAPGGDFSWDDRAILSTHNAGTTTPGADTYDQMAGTSMAAPAVSGAAALLLSLGAFSPDQVETALKTAITGFPTSTAPGWIQCVAGSCGTGILDLTQVPAPVALPVITGTPKAGATLTAAPGQWVGPPVALAYTWFMDGQVVSTDPTYVVAHKGSLSVRVSPATGAFTPIVRDSAAVATTGKKSTTKLSAPDRASKGTKIDVTVKVKVKGTKKPKGKIAIYDGNKKVGKAKLAKSDRGSITFTLTKRLTKIGKHKLVAQFDAKIGVFDSTSSEQKVKVVKG